MLPTNITAELCGRKCNLQVKDTSPEVNLQACCVLKTLRSLFGVSFLEGKGSYVTFVS